MFCRCEWDISKIRTISHAKCNFRRSTLYKNSGVSRASHADILLARHAIFGEERLRDEPKECLRGRLEFPRPLVHFAYVKREGIWAYSNAHQTDFLFK